MYAARALQVKLDIAPQTPLALRVTVLGKGSGIGAKTIIEAFLPKCLREDFRIEPCRMKVKPIALGQLRMKVLLRVGCRCRSRKLQLNSYNFV